MKLNKIYKHVLHIPNNVLIEKKNKNYNFKGPLGLNIINLSKFDKYGKVCLIKKFDLQKLIFCSNDKSVFKCIIKIIKDKISGVVHGFLLYVEVHGIGYKVEIHESKKKSNNNALYNEILRLKIGFTHDFTYVIPLSVKIFCIMPNLFCIYGIDKNQVYQIYAKIKQIKPPSVYKGKGIRLLNENIFTKIGKRK